MKCPNCGNLMVDDTKFCGICGTKAEEKPDIYDDNIEEAVLIQEAPKAKKRSKGLIAALIAAAAVLFIVLIIGGIILYFGYVNPVNPNSFLGEVFEEIGIDRYEQYDDFDDEDDDYASATPKGNFELSGTPVSSNSAVKATPTPKPREHSYVVIKEDIPWTQADYIADKRGDNSYLVSINSEEEFKRVTQMAYDEGIRVLWLGAERDSDEYWGGAEWEDDTDFQSLNLWYEGEPTYTDSQSGEAECYLMAFYVNGKWYLNDAVNDVSDVYPGKIGYIIEEE